MSAVPMPALNLAAAGLLADRQSPVWDWQYFARPKEQFT
jgi:hypothetical protein